MGNRNPDFVRKPGADFVNAERRKQADNAIGYTRAYSSECIMFSWLNTSEPIKATVDPLNGDHRDQATELVVGDSQLIDLARTKEDTKASALKATYVELNRRHVHNNVGNL